MWPGTRVSVNIGHQTHRARDANRQPEHEQVPTTNLIAKRDSDCGIGDSDDPPESGWTFVPRTWSTALRCVSVNVVIYQHHIPAKWLRLCVLCAVCVVCVEMCAEINCVWHCRRYPMAQIRKRQPEAGQWVVGSKCARGWKKGGAHVSNMAKFRISHSYSFFFRSILFAFLISF